MPNLPEHIDHAHQAATGPADPRADAHTGHYLLGATSPDVRPSTRRTRGEHRFAAPASEHVGTAVKGLFEAHPARGAAADSLKGMPDRAGRLLETVAPEGPMHFKARSVEALARGAEEYMS